MTIHLYNTLTREKEVFAPIDLTNVRMYVCGPTVYDYAHIGNARPVVVFDTLYRLLCHAYGASHVTYVRNITDIGDKIMDAARANGESIADLTARTTKYYHDDMSALNALPPTKEPRATEYVPQMIAIMETLIVKGFAYAAEGHVLFHVPAMSDYGQLSRRSLDDMIAGARVEVVPASDLKPGVSDNVERDLREGRISEALEFMSAHELSDFPPHWDPPPRIAYGETKPPLLDVLETIAETRASGWVREAYLDKLDRQFNSTHWFWHEIDDEARERNAEQYAPILLEAWRRAGTQCRPECVADHDDVDDDRDPAAGGAELKVPSPDQFRGDGRRVSHTRDSSGRRSVPVARRASSGRRRTRMPATPSAAGSTRRSATGRSGRRARTARSPSAAARCKERCSLP